MDETDVVVIGGGPAGAAAAITLAKAGRRCVVLESQPAPVWKIGETLAPESRQILQSLGVMEEFLNAGHRLSPGNCSAWGGDELLAKDFIFNPHGSAWQLDRPKFETMLLNAAEAAGANIFCGQASQTIQRRVGGWEVAAGSQVMRATWLIDASGRGSTAARQFGVARVILDKLVAIYAIASADSDADADARTYVEARPEGWWYSALLPDNRRVFAWQTDADLLPGQEWRNPQWFRERLGETRHVRSLFEAHNHRFADAPRLTSAHSGRLETCYGEGWLAVGDAAQSFDPLSGEGLFHALFTGHTAAKSLPQNPDVADAGINEYAALTNSLWNRFLRNRRHYYAAAQRWRNAPFWQRRRGPN